MLVLDDRFPSPRVRALMPEEVWSLMQLPPSLYEDALATGAGPDDLYRMAGNSIPAAMLKVVAKHIEERLQLIDAYNAEQSKNTTSSELGHHQHEGSECPQPSCVHVHDHVSPVILQGGTVHFLVHDDGSPITTLHEAFVSRKHSAEQLHCKLPASIWPTGQEQPVAFMAGEVTQDGVIHRSVSIPLPQALLHANVSGYKWVGLDDYECGLSVDAAIQAAAVAVRHSSRPSLSNLLPSDVSVFQSGKIGAKRAKKVSISCETREVQWDTSQQQGATARAKLKAHILSIDDDDPQKEYLTGWAERICEPPLDEIPECLKHERGTYAGDDLRDLPFAEPCKPPTTTYLPRLPPQTPVMGFNPTSLRDLLDDHAIDVLIPAWVRGQLQDLHAYRKYGPEAVRNHNRVLAIGQDSFKPQAQGKIWDLRKLGEGIITLLDYSADVPTHLNRGYIKESLADCRRQGTSCEDLRPRVCVQSVWMRRTNKTVAKCLKQNPNCKPI